MRSSENNKPEKSSSYHKKIYFFKNKSLQIISMRSSENKNRNYAKVREKKKFCKSFRY